MSRTILVTGGLGYLGGRLCQALAADPGQRVVATSRSAGKAAPDWLAPASLQALDLFGDGAALRAACRGVDCIVHLAQANDVDSAADPAAALRANGLGTLALLRAAIDEKVRRFVYLSTAQVYCAPLAGRISEQTLPRPVHPYAITHRTAEDFVLAALDKREIEGVVIRLSNGTGCPASAEVNAWRLIGNDLCRQVVQSGKIVLKSSGLQWRDFIPLSDVAAGIAHLIDLPAAQLDDGLFNLGGAKPMRIIDYAEAVAARAEALFGKRPPLERVEPKPGESHPTLDYRIDKLLATGFEPKRDLAGEIDRTLELCKRHFA
jgi:UDP-glucose 4-epimerase